MRKPMALCFVLFLISAAGAQGVRDDEAVVRMIADRILKDAVFQFEGIESGKTYASAKDIPENVKIKFKSKYGEWHYTNGVLNMAMLDLAAYLNEAKYANFAVQHVAFGFDNYKVFEQRYRRESNGLHYLYPFGQLFTMEELDDFGAMGASVIEVYQKVNRSEYRDYVEKAAKHLIQERLRLDDGTFARAFPNQNTLWGDDLYMSVPFLVRMGKLTGDRRYTDDAVKQVLNFNKVLWDPGKELYYHCYFSDLKRNGVAHWGRCNGWIIMAQVQLLNFLPADHPQRDALIQLLEQQILGVAKYQNPDGLWHQLLDKNDSYVESSCSAMFVYAIARAVNQGWIDKRYASIAAAGWEGLKAQKITADGQMKDVCIGTGIENDLGFYYKRPVGLNEKHGLGALIEAGIEILKLQTSREK